jgi:nucleoside-diphosphate-sugar epimerase
MAKILITGGAGFIGSNLCHRFIADGHEVICVDNFISGSKKNVEDLLANPKFSLIEYDIITPLPPAITEVKVDAIFHFACPASPNPNSPVSYMAHPIETLMVSSVGSKNMLDLARTFDCQMIFASTSEVYGDPLVHPQTEEYWGNVSPNGPRSCYDEGKRFMEALAFTYFRKFQTKIKVIRIFNTYGPAMRLDDGRFTINLIDAYINHKPFKIFGKGNSTRSFCFVDDLVDGIVSVYQKDNTIGQVINLGNPGEYTLSEAITVFESIIGTQLEKEIHEEQPDDPKRRKPDIAKAKALLGWEPKVDFKTGMQKTLEYYQHE